MSFSIKWLFLADYMHYDGIPPVNIYLMRLVYILMVIFVGRSSLAHILNHEGAWDPKDAMAWCVWAAFAFMALLGIFRTARMVPVLLLEVFYKVLWLALVAYPLWGAGKLVGSPAEGMTQAFTWVVLPVIAIPWPYVFRTYLLGRKTTVRVAGERLA